MDRDDRNHREYNYIRLKVLTEEGRKYADIEIPFVKLQQEVREIKARTIQPDGSIADFNGKIFRKDHCKSKRTQVSRHDVYVPRMFGSERLLISYEVNGSVYLEDSSWILSGDLFTKKAKFSLKPDTYYSLRCNWPAGLPEGTNPPEILKNKEVRMETRDVAAFQTEDYMPPERVLKFRIEFIYSLYSISDPTLFWQRYGKGVCGVRHFSERTEAHGAGG